MQQFVLLAQQTESQPINWLKIVIILAGVGIMSLFAGSLIRSWHSTISNRLWNWQNMVIMLPATGIFTFCLWKLVQQFVSSV